MSDLRDVVTIAEAALEWSRSTSSLVKAAQRGVLRARKVGPGRRAVWITTREAMAEYVAHASDTKTKSKVRFYGMVDDRERREKRREELRVKRLLRAGREYQEQRSVD